MLARFDESDVAMSQPKDSPVLAFEWIEACVMSQESS
jgi:hypothetical protein